MANRTPMKIRKKKLEGVSKPSQLEKLDNGSGKIAIMRQISGRSNQAREFLTDKELLFKKIRIRINETIAVMDISICKLVIFFPS